MAELGLLAPTGGVRCLFCFCLSVTPFYCDLIVNARSASGFLKGFFNTFGYRGKFVFVHPRSTFLYVARYVAPAQHVEIKNTI